MGKLFSAWHAMTVAFASAHATAEVGTEFAKAYGANYAPATSHTGFHHHPHPGERSALGQLRDCNTIAVNASGLDHTPVPAGDRRVFGEQLGPHRASRAMAIT